MARLKGAVCRTCRVEGAKLFLKGDRCYSTKCSFSKREYGPGMHGAKKKRQRPSNYRVQLREKQKVRKSYGIMEKQFRKYYDKASAMGGVTGTNMLQLLESRLDNLVYKLGFAQSRAQARQMVNHGHILVAGKKLSIASCHIKIGVEVAVSEKSPYFKAAKELIVVAGSRGAIPEWTTVDGEKVIGSLTALPTRVQMPQDIQENLIVEYYSR